MSLFRIQPRGSHSVAHSVIHRDSAGIVWVKSNGLIACSDQSTRSQFLRAINKRSKSPRSRSFSLDTRRLNTVQIFFICARELPYGCSLTTAKSVLSTLTTILSQRQSALASFVSYIPTAVCLSGNLGGTPSCAGKLHSERGVLNQRKITETVVCNRDRFDRGIWFINKPRGWVQCLATAARCSTMLTEKKNYSDRLYGKHGTVGHKSTA